MSDGKVSAALADWISGEVVARRTVDPYGSEVIVMRDGDGYTVLRGFRLGEDNAAVSVDLQAAPVTELIQHLLDRYSL